MTASAFSLVAWYERSIGAGAPCTAPDQSTLERWWRECADARVMMAIAARFEARPVLLLAATDIVESVLVLLCDRGDDARELLTSLRTFTDGAAPDVWQESAAQVSLRNDARASSAYAASALAALVDLATSDERTASSASEAVACAALAVAASAEEARTTSDAFIERDAHLAWAAGVVRRRIRCPVVHALDAESQ